MVENSSKAAHLLRLHKQSLRNKDHRVGALVGLGRIIRIVWIIIVNPQEKTFPRDGASTN